MNNPAPSRRRFRYSLRALFLAVTLLCLWLGYQTNWIRQRHAALASVREEEVGVLVSARTFTRATTPAPWPLGWFGEEGHFALAVPANADDHEREHIQKLFPEAKVTVGLWQR